MALLKVRGLVKIVWPPARRRWRRFRSASGRDRRPAGAQRRRQDDHLSHGLRHDRSGRRPRDARRQDVTNWPMYRRAKEGGMGYLAQESSVFRKLSVQKNLLGVMEMLGMNRKVRNRRAEQLMEQFGITHLRKSKAMSLSGGERRRLEIARAWSPIRRSSCSTSRSPASTR